VSGLHGSLLCGLLARIKIGATHGEKMPSILVIRMLCPIRGKLNPKVAGTVAFSLQWVQERVNTSLAPKLTAPHTCQAEYSAAKKHHRARFRNSSVAHHREGQLAWKRC
jgi:hypothetical protein